MIARRGVPKHPTHKTGIDIIRPPQTLPGGWPLGNGHGSTDSTNGELMRRCSRTLNQRHAPVSPDMTRPQAGNGRQRQATAGNTGSGTLLSRHVILSRLIYRLPVFGPFIDFCTWVYYQRTVTSNVPQTYSKSKAKDGLPISLNKL
jgi:hypothetical protein